MIRKAPVGLHEIGPFFDGKALSALLAEAAKIMLPASTHFCIHFKLRAHVDHMTAIGFMEIRDKWGAKFFGEPFEPAKYAELRRTKPNQRHAANTMNLRALDVVDVGMWWT